MDESSLGMGGDLAATKIARPVIHGKRADMTHYSDDAIIDASQFFATALRAKHLRGVSVIGLYELGSGLVTTVGVNLLATDWSNATATLKLANYHDSGTGITAAAIGDVALQTATGVARVAGVQSNPVAGQYRTVATVAYAAAFAVTEFGLFTAATAGTMWDHKVFAAINVASGDAIQFTYTLTIAAGG